MTWPLDVCGGVGYGWFYWFSLYWKSFFPNLSEVSIFFPVQFFFSFIRHERYFFQRRTFFSQEFICMLFSSWNQSAGQLFLKSPITPSKVKWSAPKPKLHQTFGQLTDSDLSIISEGASRMCRLCYKVATQKTFWIHTSNIVCGVSRGVGPVWIGKWARNA